MKIGILGGTFNPIHNGHLILAQNALEFCNLEKVLFMPSGCSYLKNQSLILPKNRRIDMVEFAIEDNPCFELSTIETDRAGNTYTYETLQQLHSISKDEYYFIVGDDTLFSIETWRNPDIIFDLATLVVAPRDFIDINKILTKKITLEQKFNANIIILDTPNIDISSHMIREKIKSSESFKDYLPEKVYDYIILNNLYI